MNKLFSRNGHIALFLVCFSFCMNAQQQSFIGGVLLSLNGIGITGESGKFWSSAEEVEAKGHGGFSAGVFVKREFTKTLYTTLELRYISKGSLYSFVDMQGSPGYESLYLKYIALPLLVGYKQKAKKRPLYFESGFVFAKLIASKIDASNRIYRTGTPVTKGFNNYDVLWVGSMKYPLIKKWQDNILLGIRVSNSLTSINDYYKIYNLNYGIEINYVFN